jgi:hypothetical protein
MVFQILLEIQLTFLVLSFTQKENIRDYALSKKSSIIQSRSA